MRTCLTGVLVLTASSVVSGAPTEAFWRDVPGAKFDGVIRRLRVLDMGTGPALYVGGGFTAGGATGASFLTRWDGSAWAGVGGPLSSWVEDMAVVGAPQSPTLYVAGFFNLPGVSGGGARTVARLSNGAWTPLDGTPAPNTWIGWITAYDDGTGEALYASGGWDIGGGISYIARWSPSQWSALGSGLFTIVSDSMEYTGAGAPRSLWLAGGLGIVSQPGGILSLGIARWDGQWHSVGGGMDSIAYAITAFDDGRGEAVYICGEFSRGGAPPNTTMARRIARWDGTHWEPLGQGLNSTGNALAVFDDGHGASLYTAGKFTVAGETPASSIARWDGQTWHAVDGGINGEVKSLVVYDPDGPGAASPGLFAAGTFTRAGAVAVQNFAVLVAPPSACTGDATGDRLVDTQDLVALLGVFGRSFVTGTPSDMNADGVVNTADLVVMLSAFGTDCR